VTLHAAPRPTAHRPAATRTGASALPDLGTLVPWRAWLHHPALRTGSVAVVLVLVVVPPLGLRLADRDLDTAVVLFAAYFAAAWWLLLRTVLRPVSPGAAVTTGLVLLALFTQVPIAVLLEQLLDADTENLFAGILGVGLPEEFVKALPVAAVVLALRSRGRMLEPRDVLFLGVISGIVFGAAEACTTCSTCRASPSPRCGGSSRTPPSTVRGPASPPSSSASPPAGIRRSGRPSRAWGSRSPPCCTA